MGRVAAAVFLMASVGCQGSASPEEAALIFVVRDMAGLLPTEVVNEPRRYLAPRFGAPSRGSPIPSSVHDASGLRLASESQTQDSTVVVLNLFEPIGFGLDSIVVIAEWLVFSEDDPSFWGQDWRYVLRCDPTCAQLRRFGPGHLN